MNKTFTTETGIRGSGPDKESLKGMGSMLQPNRLKPTRMATDEELQTIFGKKADIIDHPNHYIQGIECWDYITSHNMDYLQGNIIKYVTRYKHKNGLEDLKKAKAYLDKCINLLTEKNS